LFPVLFVITIKWKPMRDSGDLNLHFSPMTSPEVGKCCGDKARVEKHPRAYPKSSLSCSMLRMVFKRNAAEAVLHYIAADRLREMWGELLTGKIVRVRSLRHIVNNFHQEVAL
jgi:hypothetical protein